MKNKIYFLGLLPFLLTGCELVGNHGGVDPVKPKDKYTIMIYMCGSDLESSDGAYLATADLKEICSIADQPDNVNIIVETGGAKKWSTKYGVSSTKIGRWHIENQTLVSDEQLPNSNMGKSATFQSFMEWGLDKYPAEKTGVILWNHGGAMDGCCYDENYNDDCLTPVELNTALDAAFINAKQTTKLEWIGYDACDMAIQDIAEFNSKYFNYMVSSEESEAGEGWDYDKWVDKLFANPSISSEQLLPQICDSFIADNERYGSSNNDQTLSVLDLSNMPAYKLAWDKLISDISIGTSTEWKSLTTVINKCTKYAYYDDREAQSYNGGYLFDIFDIGDFIKNMKSSSTFSKYSTDLNDLDSTYKDLVMYNKVGKAAGTSSGLCLFCPISGYNEKSVYTTTKTNFTSWSNLCATYGSWYRSF